MLAACSPAGDEAAPPAPTASASAAAAYRIACAHGAAPLTRACTVERDEHTGALTIRFSDGGFRRVLPAGDGRGIAAADGAERAHVAMVDTATSPTPGGGVEVEVRIGNDRFRLPAHRKAAASGVKE